MGLRVCEQDADRVDRCYAGAGVVAGDAVPKDGEEGAAQVCQTRVVALACNYESAVAKQEVSKKGRRVLRLGRRRPCTISTPMTAVFSPTDALRHDRHLSRDDSQFESVLLSPRAAVIDPSIAATPQPQLTGGPSIMKCGPSLSSLVLLAHLALGC